MTIMRTNVDGKDYLVLHYRFAINNPDATIRKSNDTYFADIGNKERQRSRFNSKQIRK